MECSIIELSKNYVPDESENVLKDLFDQYEYVIIHSIITSFGLDFLINDQYGGDVDTIHNVRKIGKDPFMTYKNKQNELSYNSIEGYVSSDYHKDSRYQKINKEISQQKKDGKLMDSYTGAKIARNGKTDLDHVISAKEIHYDRGRVLSGLNGVDLANNDCNLKATDPHLNRTKKALPMDEYLDKYCDEYNSEQKLNMQQIDAKARKNYNSRLAHAYYTGSNFISDMTAAAGKVGVQMGLRQLFGVVFTEIWFSVKAEFTRLDVSVGLDMDVAKFFEAVGSGIKKGFESAKKKYKHLLSEFKTGTIAGSLASLTTTLCNIFFTTAQNTIKIIRQSWASIVEAAKILIINPQSYPFGERMRAAAKVIATGASIIVGGLVREAVSKTPVAAIPEIGDIVQNFCGILCTGIMSCTLLHYIDKSKLINDIVSKLNLIHTIEDDINYYKQQAVLFEKYAAELMNIDICTFRRESEAFNRIAKSISAATTPEELNVVLKKSAHSLGFTVSW